MGGFAAVWGLARYLKIKYKRLKISFRGSGAQAGKPAFHGLRLSEREQRARRSEGLDWEGGRATRIGRGLSPCQGRGWDGWDADFLIFRLENLVEDLADTDSSMNLASPAVADNYCRSRSEIALHVTGSAGGRAGALPSYKGRVTRWYERGRRCYEFEFFRDV